MEDNIPAEVLNGADLILSIDGEALGFATGCKISTTAETGERRTKETSGGMWPEKYVKGLSEEISGDGLTLRKKSDGMPTYDEIKAKMLARTPITAHYSLRDGDKRTGKAAGGYTGKFLITSLEIDGQAGDDSKYSFKLSSHGPVTKVENGNGLQDVINNA